MAQALYRKYRPKDFDNVVGQEHITTVLKNEMAAGKPAHAYLFVGSRGTGKTSCAKIVAKAVNCLNPKDGNPCGECEICRGIDSGAILDVEEIDAASNNGVDSIRDLRDEAAFTPAVAKYRVYIIDEVHMLSTSAFNALLKILEEPPEHIIFILATTEIQKVLPTIISRCQRFDFRRIESDVIAGRLETVCRAEGVELDRDAAVLIARLSDGGMRDALSLLDVCVSRSGAVSAETVAQAAGLAGSEHLFDLAELMIEKDPGKLLEKASELFQKSMEPQRLCEQLAGHFRNLMLAKTIPDPSDLISSLPSEIGRLREQAGKLSLAEIMNGLSVLQEALAKMSRSTVKRAELELSLIRLCSPMRDGGAGAGAAGLAALLERVERLEAALADGAAEGRLKPAPASARLKEPDGIPEPASVTDSPHGLEKPPAERASRGKAAEAVPFAAWPEVLDALSELNPSVSGMLAGSKAFDDGRRILIDVQNPILLDMLKSNEYTKTVIKQAISMATGRSCGLGPYRRPKEEKKKDPLEDLINSLPEHENIKII